MLSINPEMALPLPGGSFYRQPPAARTGLSEKPGTRNGALASQKFYAMMQVEVQSLKSMQFANGATITENLSFSYQEEATLAAYGKNPHQPDQFSGSFTQMLYLEHQLVLEGPVTQEQMDFFNDYFSPEKTAERISNFALSGFNGDMGNPEARAGWVDFILPAVERSRAGE